MLGVAAGWLPVAAPHPATVRAAANNNPMTGNRSLWLSVISGMAASLATNRVNDHHSIEVISARPSPPRPLPAAESRRQGDTRSPWPPAG